MIGKQVIGTSFGKVLNYLHNKEKADQIGGNMAGRTPQQLTEEFSRSRALNPSLKRVVYHASLSVPRHEAQPDEQWVNIAQNYMEEMGFGNCQYAVYRHHDREHDHIHIVASRIQFTDGKTVTDSWNYPRSEGVVRELEALYQLEPVQRKKEGECSPTTSEMRELERTGERSVRQQLQDILNQTIAQTTNLIQLVERLRAAGVSVRVSRSGKGLGISYEKDGVSFSGTHLGRDFTFPGLQKHRGLNYDPNMDDELLRPVAAPDSLRATLPTPTAELTVAAAPEADSLPEEKVTATVEVESRPIEARHLQLSEALYPLFRDVLLEARREQLVEQIGENLWQLAINQYLITYDKDADMLSLAVEDGRGDLMCWHIEEGKGVLAGVGDINQKDIENFRAMTDVMNDRHARSLEVEPSKSQSTL